MKVENEFAKRSIELELKVQEKLGKKTFKDIWIGDGWLSKNKQGTVTFKPGFHREHKWNQYLKKLSR